MSKENNQKYFYALERRQYWKDKRFQLIPATFAVIIFAGMSEYCGEPFSILNDYIFSDPDRKTVGTIKSSTIKRARCRSARRYDISYIYSVEGIEYAGSRINYDVKTTDTLETVKRYAPGSPVQIYYDSLDPNYAVLEKSDLGNGVIIVLFALALLFLIFIFL